MAEGSAPNTGAEGSRISDTSSLDLARSSVSGDPKSFEVLLERIQPLLIAQARLRLGPVLGQIYDPEDLVQECWVVATPQLEDLVSRSWAEPALLLAFLGRTLLYLVNNLVRKHITGKPHRVPLGSESRPAADLLQSQSGAITRICRAERRCAVTEALDRLEEMDRKIVLLRGLEQHPVREIAEHLGCSANLVSVRYRRALERLQRILPGSVFEDLDPVASPG